MKRKTRFDLPMLLRLFCAVVLWLPVTTAFAEKSPSDWLETFDTLNRQSPAHCSRPELPRIPHDTPSRAFVLEGLAAEVLDEPRAVYAQDPIAETLIVLALGADGCVHAGISGRNEPFDERSIPSIYPNTLIPGELGHQDPVAIIADAKSIRPWVYSMPASEFTRFSAGLWTWLGLYTGILTVLLMVGVAYARWQRKPVAYAYVIYAAALQFYQFQALGLGAAWLPFWPGPEHARLMQALGVIALIVGIGAVVLTFMKPRIWLRVVVIGGVSFSSVSLIWGIWSPFGYRLASVVLIIMALSIVISLIRDMRDAHGDMRWFAAGLAASVLGGGTQALAIVTDGAGLPGVASTAFPIGNLFEAICWVVALTLRFSAERRRLQDALRHDATHDSLTRLYNRGHMRARINEAIHYAQAHPGRVQGLLFVDLDGFKRVNDRMGHAVGDQVLEAVARALETLQLHSEAIGRLGGDEYAILIRRGLPWAVTLGDAESLVSQFRKALSVRGRPLAVGASVGVVAINQSHTGFDEVVRDADTALYVAKRRGGGRWIEFETQMRADAETRQRMREELTIALKEGQLSLHYQPILEFAELRPVGFEALLRWRHPRRGLLSASEFLTLAEECGLMRDIGQVVVNQVLGQIQLWQSEGRWCRGEFMSINLSPQELADKHLVKRLEDALERYHVDPGSLRMEIPERALVQDSAITRETVLGLVGLGTLVTVDNFGTGLSPITPLAEIGIDAIKLDAKVVSGIVHRGRSQNLARVAVNLGTDLGSLVVAEGIEAQDQFDMVQELGISYGQGQLFAGAMPGYEVMPWCNLWRLNPNNPGGGAVMTTQH